MEGREVLKYKIQSQLNNKSSEGSMFKGFSVTSRAYCEVFRIEAKRSERACSKIEKKIRDKI